MNVWMLQNDRWKNVTLHFDREYTTCRIEDSKKPFHLYDAVVTGGTFFQFLSDIHSEPNAALLIDRSCFSFPLPCRSGIGKICDIDEDRYIWQRSDDLCCEYACDPCGKIFLRDTRETLTTKIALARQVGIESIFLSNKAHKIITAPSK